MDLKLAGRTALVTGASQGIGEALAKSFADEGVDLHLTARNEAALASVKKEIQEKHGISTVSYTHLTLPTSDLV